MSLLEKVKEHIFDNDCKLVLYKMYSSVLDNDNEVKSFICYELMYLELFHDEDTNHLSYYVWHPDTFSYKQRQQAINAFYERLETNPFSGESDASMPRQDIASLYGLKVSLL